MYAISNNPEVVDAFVNNVAQKVASYNAPNVKPSQYFFGPSSTQSETFGSATSSCEGPENGLTDIELGLVTSSQSKTFVKTDGTIDIDKGYQEVLRRAEGYPNFHCSKERFTNLCTENGVIGSKKMQEAISALQLEAQGKISNVRRDPIAEQNGICGLDFIAEDKNHNTIHLEIKGPVGSAIKLAEGDDPSVTNQGNSIGRKIAKQVDNWKGSTQITPVESSENVLVVFDLFDVPVSEKAQLQNAINSGIEEGVQASGCQRPMSIFINNIRNR